MGKKKIRALNFSFEHELALGWKLGENYYEMKLKKSMF